MTDPSSRDGTPTHPSTHVLYTDVALSRRKRDHALTNAFGDVLYRAYTLGDCLEYLDDQEITHVLLISGTHQYVIEFHPLHQHRETS